MSNDRSVRDASRALGDELDMPEPHDGNLFGFPLLADRRLSPSLTRVAQRRRSLQQAGCGGCCDLPIRRPALCICIEREEGRHQDYAEYHRHRSNHLFHKNSPFGRQWPASGNLAFSMGGSAMQGICSEGKALVKP